jgi:hypothetical protein
MAEISGLSRLERIVLIGEDDVLNSVNKRVLELIGFEGAIHIIRNLDDAFGFFSQLFAQTNNPRERSGTLVFIDLNFPKQDVFDLLEFLSISPIPYRESLLAILMVEDCAEGQLMAYKKLDIRIEAVFRPITKSLMSDLLGRYFFSERH